MNRKWTENNNLHVSFKYVFNYICIGLYLQVSHFTVTCEVEFQIRVTGSMNRGNSNQ